MAGLIFFNGDRVVVLPTIMHETHLLESIFRYLDREEKASSRKIVKICVALSDFGGISEDHFREHYKEESIGTKWEFLDLEIKRVPYGPELEITRLYFK